MSELLFFVIGLLIGGLASVTTICLCIITKEKDVVFSKNKKDTIENKASKF